MTWLRVAIIYSIAFFAAEVATNPDVNGPVNALWWGITTLTTVGYGDFEATTS